MTDRLMAELPFDAVGDGEPNCTDCLHYRAKGPDFEGQCMRGFPMYRNLARVGPTVICYRFENREGPA